MIQRTLLRRMISTDEYYCVIEHDLEKFKLKVVKSWEVTNKELPTTFLIQDGIHYPNYVTTKRISDYEYPLLNTNFEIDDVGNVFARLAKIFTSIDMLKFLADNKSYDLHYNTRKNSLFFLDEETEDVLSILEPSRGWEGKSFEVSYNVNNVIHTVLPLLLEEGGDDNEDYYITKIKGNMLSYPIFRTVWYDVIIQQMYYALTLEAFNMISRQCSKWGKECPYKLAPDALQSANCNYNLLDSFTKFSNKLLDTQSLPDFYSRLNDLKDVNKGFVEIYKTVMNSITFKTDRIIAWEYFYKEYEQALTDFVISTLYYMRWRYMCDMVVIPEEYNVPLKIKLTFGTLIMRGGRPVWDAL